MRLYVTYTPCAISLRGETDNITTFTQFEEGGLLYETRNSAESSDKSNDQAQKGFRVIFFGIPQHQTGYLVYVTSTRKIISSYDVVVVESFSSVLAYTSQPYS